MDAFAGYLEILAETVNAAVALGNFNCKVNGGRKNLENLWLGGHWNDVPGPNAWFSLAWARERLADDPRLEEFEHAIECECGPGDYTQ